MKKVFILSHTDLDGYISAGLVQYYIQKDAKDEKIEFKHKSWTYGRDIPDIEKIKKNYDTFVLVDLCLDNETMDKIVELFGMNFTWIDHHVIPDNNYIDYKNGELGYNYYIATQPHTYAACTLVYKYYALGKYAEDIPYWIKLVSDFDCWNRYDDKIWNEEVMPYFSYLKSRIRKPEDALKYIEELDYRSDVIHDRIVSSHEEDPKYKYSIRIIEKDIEKGSYMFQSTREMYDAECRHGFEAELEVSLDRFENINAPFTKLKAWVCNTQNRSSVIFENLKNLDYYDVLIPYHFNGQRFMYSMYTFKKNLKCNKMRVYFMTREGRDFVDFNGHDDAAGANSEHFIITPKIKE